MQVPLRVGVRPGVNGSCKMSIVVGDGVRSRCAQPSRLIAEALDSPVLRAAGADSAWLVRDLAEGYRGLLDRQAQLLLGAT